MYLRLKSGGRQANLCLIYFLKVAMDNNFLRFYKPKILIYLIVGLGIVIFLGSFIISNEISFIAFSAVIGILYLIDKFLWRYRPFKWLLRIPDFSGSYEGLLRYEYRDENCNIHSDELRHKKEIIQTGSSLLIKSYTYKKNGELSSPSTSLDVVVQDEKDGSFKLIYSYLNEGRPNQGFPLHYGTETVIFSETNGVKNLEGDYYTNRVPIQTRGEFLNLKQIQK